MHRPLAVPLGRLLGVASVGLGVLAAGCDPGCGSLPEDWQALGPRSAGSPANRSTITPTGTTGGTPSLFRGTDCPDGLARCEDGRVWVSRLATIPSSASASAPCGAASAPCVCPWDSIAACQGSCAAEGAVAVMERGKAALQMCTPGRAGELPFAQALPPLVPPSAPLPPDIQAPSDCDEDDAYRCSDSVVVDCALRRPVGRCSKGCSSPGATLFGDRIDRESAFAILCSR